MRGKRLTIIQVFILTGYIGVPATALTLFLYSPRSLAHVIFFIFIVCHSFERVWETFYTTRERHADQLHGDWTLVLVTVAYLALCFATIAEFFLRVNQLNPAISILGFACYFSAFWLRWWGIKSLGRQWAIHAVGARKIRKIRLIKIGAFKYIRHPIYVSIMIEVLSIPIIANAVWSLMFAAFVNVPFQFVRLLEEEKTSIRRFGQRYRQYQQEVSMLVPIKYFKKKIFSRDVAC